MELVPAVKTAIEEDYEDNNGFIPIFVIRRTSGSPFLGGGNANFPFSGFAGFNPFDIFGSQPRDDDQEQFTPSIFDTPTTVIEENDENDDGNGHPCGFLCTILKDFDTKLREIQDEVRDLHEQTNETEGNQEQDGFDVNNSTYTEKVWFHVTFDLSLVHSTSISKVFNWDFCFDGSRRGTALYHAVQCHAEPRHYPSKQRLFNTIQYLCINWKVLPDGTVVKINRTVISDSSDDGSSFYFHSTSLHNFDQSKEPEEEAKEEPQEPEIEVESELDDEDFEEFPEAATEVEIPMLDEALNEVPENVNIDDILAWKTNLACFQQ